MVLPGWLCSGTKGSLSQLAKAVAFVMQAEAHGGDKELPRSSGSISGCLFECTPLGLSCDLVPASLGSVGWLLAPKALENTEMPKEPSRSKCPQLKVLFQACQCPSAALRSQTRANMVCFLKCNQVDIYLH